MMLGLGAPRHEELHSTVMMLICLQAQPMLIMFALWLLYAEGKPLFLHHALVGWL